MAEKQLKIDSIPEVTSLDAEKEVKKEKIRKIITRVIVYLLLTVVAVLAILPFYWMIISSLKTEAEYRSSVPTFFPTQGIEWQNYASVVFYNINAKGVATGQVFTTTLVNTIIVGLISTAIGLVLTILTAYAFARLNFKGKNLIFALMLATMMIPGELYTITNFTTAVSWKMVDTYAILILPFLVNFYYIYLLRNNFKQIPESLYKAAKVDGTSDMGYLFKVMVPLTMPTIISISLLRFIGTWNSYIWPRLVSRNAEWKMITNWVTQTFTQSGSSEALTTWKMAASCMATLPLLILFLCFRKYIMQGVSKSGTKG